MPRRRGAQQRRMKQAKFDLAVPGARRRAWWDMIMVDHGIFRLLWTNGWRVSNDLFRSNHPLS
jgi:hypothetical protein